MRCEGRVARKAGVAPIGLGGNLDGIPRQLPSLGVVDRAARRAGRGEPSGAVPQAVEDLANLRPDAVGPD